MKYHRDTIIGFEGDWRLGIALLRLQHRGPVPCDNAPTVRLLDQLFGDVIQSGHCVNVDRIKGEEIVFTHDYGILLGSLMPLWQWDGPEIEPGQCVEVESTDAAEQEEV